MINVITAIVVMMSSKDRHASMEAPLASIETSQLHMNAAQAKSLFSQVDALLKSKKIGSIRVYQVDGGIIRIMFSAKPGEFLGDPSSTVIDRKGRIIFGKSS